MEENKKVIKSLSTVLNDGTLSEGIPFGAKAENVVLASGTELQDVFEVKTIDAYDGPLTLDRDHGTDPDSWMGFFTSFEIEEGKIYDVIVGDHTYTGLVSQIFAEEDGMKSIGISSTGEPVEYGTVGEWQLISYYQNGTFLTTMFDTYDAVDKYQNGSYLKISYTDEEIKEMFLPEDYTDITIQDLDELTITLITEKTGLNLDSFMMALMGMNVSILNKVRVCLMEETPMGGIQFKYFKFYLGDWDIASDSPVICLMSDPYVKANGKVYIDTFKGYIANDENMSIQGELVTKCINNAQPDWEIPGETSEASIKNKPFYEEKFLFEEHVSFETAETVEHEFLKWEKEGDFEFTDSAYLEFTPYGITDGTVYTFQPNDSGEEYIQFRDIPVNGIDTTKVFHVSFRKYNPGTSDFRTPNTIEVEFTVDDPAVVPTISWEKLALYSGIIKKIDPKFLPEGYGASDWDQNDETAADYIKNRTHYMTTEIKKSYSFYPEQALGIDSGQSYYSLSAGEGVVTRDIYKQFFDENPELEVYTDHTTTGRRAICRTTIGDIVIDYNVVISQYYHSWTGYVYSIFSWQQISDIDITQTYPFIGEITFGKIFFTSAEDWEQNSETIMIKQEMLAPKDVYKTLDRGYLPYYQGIHFEEAFNDSNIATGYYSHAEGYNTVASGTYSHAEGNNTVAEGSGSHAEGRYTRTLQFDAHAEGQFTYARGEGSHAEGESTIALGNHSHAEGASNTQDDLLTSRFNIESTDISNRRIYIPESEWDDERIREGYAIQNTDAIIWDINKGNRWIAISPITEEEFTNLVSSSLIYIDQKNVAAGFYSHTEGVGTYAGGRGSHAEGTGTVATADSQHVQGRYNIEDTENRYAHIVGNGYRGEGSGFVPYIDRSNAYTLDWDGNGTFAGKVTVGAAPVNNMDVATKQYVDEHVPDVSDITIENASSTVAGVLKVRLDETTNTLYITNDGSDA